MFTLLHPAALLALAGLLVPVAIHLFNRRPAREVAVGSLRWLAAGANRRLRQLKLEQLGLLLLRAALLAVLAVAVAGPVWRTTRPASRGVVLLSAEAAQLPALVALKPAIDSLRRRGYALRWLAADFPWVPVPAWRALSTGRASAAADSAAGQTGGWAWARVRQAAATFPGQPLYVVTSSALRNFRGSHGPLPATVNWQVLPDTTTASWLAAAETADGKNLSLLVGHSNGALTTYRWAKVRVRHQSLPMQVAGLAPVRLQAGSKGGENLVLVPVSAPKSDDGIAFGRPPMLIEIYASPEFAADARYLEAALRAAGSALAIAPRVRRQLARPTRLQADWTFWLSGEPLPSAWQADLKNHRNLWREAAGPGVADTASFATEIPGDAPAAVFRRAAAAEPGGETVWADGRGRALLARHSLSHGNIYQLTTRFNPAWSELADDPQLPARLLELLQPEPACPIGLPLTQLARLEAAHDRRALDPAQLPATSGASARATRPKIEAPAAFRQTDLRPWLVLLAALLLLVERLLAHRRETATLPAAR